MMILMRLKLTVSMKEERLKRRDVDIQFSSSSSFSVGDRGEAA